MKGCWLADALRGRGCRGQARAAGAARRQDQDRENGYQAAAHIMCTPARPQLEPCLVNVITKSPYFHALLAGLAMM